MTKKKRLIIILLAVVVLISGYLCFENTALINTEYTVTNKNLPKEADGCKIVQISDYHNTKNKLLTKQIVKSVTSQKPDIIVITGDLIDGYRTDIETSLSLVRQIKDVAPIYYVTGNHESDAEKYFSLAEGLNAEGVRILDNESEKIKIGNSEMIVAGVSDPTMIHEYGVDDSMIVGSEIERSGAVSDAFTLLLSHRPELFDTYLDKDIDLVLSGHAHGGQIRIPFVGGLFAPNQGTFPKYTGGIYHSKSTDMIVSRGLGNSLFPFRVNNRPELVTVTLKCG